MNRTVLIGSLDGLVAWIAANRHYAGTKWKLEDRASWEWDDEGEGAAWQAKMDQLELEYPNFSSRNQTYYDKRTALHDAMPTRHQVIQFTLVEAGAGYHSKRLSLPFILGAKIDDCWTKKASRWGSGEERVATLTIPGILKRLGNTEVGDILKAAQAREKAQSEKNQRNYARRELRRLAAEMGKHLLTLGIGSNIPVYNLETLEEEE